MIVLHRTVRVSYLKDPEKRRARNRESYMKDPERVMLTVQHEAVKVTRRLGEESLK